MKRIILHWTAGHNTPSDNDLSHYHYVISGRGVVMHGKHPVSANIAPVKGKYAAHTLNCNTGSIGVAVAAMALAEERPFKAGPAPITAAQVSALANLCAHLCKEYSIPVTRQTVLTHAEVQPTLGIAQKGKWDITWLPGMDKPGDAVMIGDILRDKVLWAMKPNVKETPRPEHDAPDMLTKPVDVNMTPDPVAKRGFWAALMQFFALFAKKSGGQK